MLDQSKSSMVQNSQTQTSFARREKARRSRNLALGLIVGFLAFLFYAVTIVKISQHGFVPNPSFESDVKP